MNSTPNHDLDNTDPAGTPVDLDAVIPDDPRLLRAVQEYLQELEAGRRPDRRRWLERDPDLAVALEQCLDGLDMVHQAVPQDDSVASAADNLLGLPGQSEPIGDFKLLREIGRGGMGIVYEALQLSLGRRVALKILPFAAAFDVKHLQRFRLEAQAAAHLHHTNIVPVYAVGSERGIHYYAMQLIDGQSLDTVIRQLRSEAGLEPLESLPSYPPSPAAGSGLHPAVSASAASGPRASAGSVPEPLPPTHGSGAAPQTAQVFSTHLSAPGNGKQREYFRRIAHCMLDAAEALEYAHQAGVIHRDIKPANLLIDQRGNVWITDFGLAHFHETAELTQTGEVLGTLRYMSPEQASGQRVVLDHRTDIYSLGATFYELLTLTPMFVGSSRHTLLMAVLNIEPREPRTLNRNIPPELETIVLKALNKTPAERYASAHEMAEDLSRFLRDEPIRARRPSSLERLRKWSRRHPAVVGAGLFAMFLTLLGSLIGNWFVSQANERTKDALALEQVRAQEAEQRFQQARKAVDLLIEVSQEELADNPPLQSVSKRLLETALVYYQDFIAQRQGNPSSQAELKAVQTRLEKILDDLSVMEGAGQFILLSDRQVQEDLRLLDEQRRQIEAGTQQMNRERLESFRDFQRLTLAERRAKFIEMARGNDQLMRATLTASQRTRLEQIALQLRGAQAFSQPEVITRLRLTDSQRQAIRLIAFEGFGGLGDRDRPDKPHPGPRGPRESGWRGTVEKILAVLTPEQRAEWEKLTGAPYHGEFPRPPQRPPEPPPGENRGGPHRE